MAFFDLSPSVWMITPQETAQYGQMLRVSVVRDILNARSSARAFVRSKPRAMAPPTVVAFKKPRRESSMRHLLTELRSSLCYSTLGMSSDVADTKWKRMLDDAALFQAR